MKKVRGFSLLELMVVVTIIGAIAAVAVPSYTSYLKKTRRTDAIVGLSESAQTLERCYSQSFSYSPQAPAAPCPALMATSPSGYYSIASAVTASTYTLTATPPATSVQYQDTQCRTFTLTNGSTTGTVKDNTGADQTATCWQH